MAGMIERLMWCADLRAVVIKLPTMVGLYKDGNCLRCGYSYIMIFLLAENTASTISMVFDNAPVYRYSMCNGTEYNFFECQLPVPDSDSMCPSFATVNCTEGLHYPVSITPARTDLL